MILLAVIYLSFISLGLPDGLLGAAWPTVYPELGVPVSYAGILSVTICLGTIFSSLFSHRMTRWLGYGKVTAISVLMTAFSLLGFSFSRSFPMLLFWAIPCGLGAGGVDAALNNYVALHYSSRHMSWLHCMWGVGASVGPYIMGHILTAGCHWTSGYRAVGLIQAAVAAALFLSLPLWKSPAGSREDSSSPPMTVPQVLSVPGAKAVLVSFFCYCALEQTAGLWASSYLVLYKQIPPETAAAYASMFYIGITGGRAVNGFLTTFFSDTQLIRMGQGIIFLGIGATVLPLSPGWSLAGLILIGLGCAPIYPCIIHSTPDHFGKENSQAIIGIQMASAYVGCCLMPPVFGLIANRVSVGLLPVFLLVILVCMVWMHEKLIRVTKENPGKTV